MTPDVTGQVHDRDSAGVLGNHAAHRVPVGRVGAAMRQEARKKENNKDILVNVSQTNQELM